MEALLKTFNSLLSIAQAESGNHRSRWKKVKLNNLLADMLELYEPLAAEKNQEIEFIQNGQFKMTASRDLLAQAFSNLIENAIKYTPKTGKITVELGSDNSDSSNNKAITISFSDTGPGIPVNERDHVLERFIRLDNSRHTEGNGLSLVSAVCELHRGTLKRGHFENKKDGLIVTMKFPVT